MPKESVSKSLHTRFRSIGKFLFLAGLLIGVGLLSGYLAMRFAVRGTEVAVPKIQGIPGEEAQKILAQAGLRLQVVGERYDAQVPKGAVISQYPGPEVSIKADREVQVILSLGPRRNPVPDLKGSTLRAAQSMILQSGYEVGHITEVTLGREKDEVIQQFPPPDAQEIMSPKIDVLVGREAPKKYIMPDLLGEHLNRAISFFDSQGFKVQRIQYRAYPGVPKGAVVKQFPEPGYVLSQTDSINLEVAR